MKHAWRTLLCVCLVWLLSGCSRSQLTQHESYVFGTRVEVLVYGPDATAAHTAINEVLREFDRLHHAYHAWQPSELSSLNAAIAAGTPHRVSPELAGLIRTAQAIAKAGDYLFDPGIGGLVALWGFHGEDYAARLPDAAALAAWRQAQPSIRDLDISSDLVVSSRKRAVALDFGGYLKGVALDHAATILRQHGHNNALINIGGNVMALGKKGDTPWRVGIQHPRPQNSGGSPLATLELRDGEAIGTSGDYQRYFELDGQRYCHLLDPRSAAPATATQSLTVLIPPRPDAGMYSDASSKPLFIAGDDWQREARRLGVTHALHVDAGGRVSSTAAMQQRLHPAAP